MNTSIYDKTDKGREEIATRKFQLASRLRALLVLVDGHRPEEELLRSVAGLGLSESALLELLAQDFIVRAASKVALPEPAAPPEPQLEPQPAPTPAPAPDISAEQVLQFRSVYDFYNKTIRSTMGLRGFTLQLKVEKAGCVEDLRQLRDPYVEAVQKAKGRDIAALLAQQLDHLLEDSSLA